MRITDQYNNTLGLGTDDYAETIGIVFKTAEDIGKQQLGVIIPKYMLGYSFKNNDVASENSISVKGSKCINEDIDSYWDKSIMIKNYIIVNPFLNQNQSMSKYTVGDRVLINLIDNDIKTLSFMPYSINRLGQRATDKLLFAVPANEHENMALTEDNAYYLKLDSSKDVQVAEIGTSKQNGETCYFKITLDSKNGTLTIADDSGDRSWILDYNNDSVTSKTSGSTIEQSADKITETADTIEIKAKTKLVLNAGDGDNCSGGTMEVQSDTIKRTSKDVDNTYDKYKQTTDSGDFEITQEKHNGTSVAFKGSTFHCDMPTIGLNGEVVLPSFTIGAIPDINVPVPSVNGTSGPKGSTVFQTDPAGVPLVKYPQLLTCLTQLAAAADMYPSGAGMGSSAVAAFSAGGSTTKIMSS